MVVNAQHAGGPGGRGRVGHAARDDPGALGRGARQLTFDADQNALETGAETGETLVLRSPRLLGFE
jgi:hypothetical protein